LSDAIQEGGRIQMGQALMDIDRIDADPLLSGGVASTA
jgi:hypothetical protein